MEKQSPSQSADAPLLPLEIITPTENKQHLKSFERVKDVLGFILGLGSLLTAMGFFTVQSFISRYTDLHFFNIAPQQYIAAGINWIFIFTVFLLIINSSFRFHPYMYRLMAGIKHLSSMVRTRRLSSPKDFKQKIDEDDFVIGMAETYSSKTWGISNRMIIALFSTLVISMVYGASLYTIMPKFLGGGQPATVILVFKESVDPSNFSLSVDANFKNHTLTVYLLAELTDGVLVLDPRTGHTAAIKNDVISGILDDQTTTRMRVYTATPQPTPTLTPAVTPTP